MVVTAIVAPSALYGAVATQAVSITDPNTGAKSYITPSRALYVYDGVAGYANNPANLVNLKFVTGNEFGACSNTGYTVPSGKALIIRSITGYARKVGTTSSGYQWALNTSSSCSGSDITIYETTASDSAPFNLTLGTGVAVPSGSPLAVYNFHSFSALFVEGYLVPATAVPAVGSADAALQTYGSGPSGRGKL